MPVHPDQSQISSGAGTGWVAANLVMGVDGSTTINGRSKGLSTPADRTAFHRLRSQFDAILVGGNTARNEPYQSTPLPLIVLSRHPLSGVVSSNPLAERWDLPLASALQQARRRFGRILIEAGPALIGQALRERLLDELFLTRSPISGGENLFDLGPFLEGAEEVSREEVESTLLLRYLF